MTLAYRLALFLHIAALLAAIGASTLLHFVQHRLAAAERASEAHAWIGLSLRVSIVFPIALLTLVVTGGYMVSQGWTWSAGWVVAGLVGVAILFVNGMRLGARGRATLGRLQRAGDAPLDRSASSEARGTAMTTYANTGIATAVVFVMSLKLGLAASCLALAVGAIAGAALGARSTRGAPSSHAVPSDTALDAEREIEPA